MLQQVGSQVRFNPRIQLVAELVTAERIYINTSPINFPLDKRGGVGIHIFEWDSVVSETIGVEEIDKRLLSFLFVFRETIGG